MAPTTADVAVWDATVLAANTVTLGVAQSYQGLRIANPGGAVIISPGAGLTLGASGIDMAAATQNLTIQTPLTLGSFQTWNVGAGRTLAVSSVIDDAGGAFGFTKSGTGTATLSGVNTYTGLTTVNAGSLILTSTQTTARSYVVNNLATLAVNGLQAAGSVFTLNNGSTLTTNQVLPTTTSFNFVSGTINYTSTAGNGTLSNWFGNAVVNFTSNTGPNNPNNGAFNAFGGTVKMLGNYTPRTAAGFNAAFATFDMGTTASGLRFNGSHTAVLGALQSTGTTPTMTSASNAPVTLVTTLAIGSANSDTQYNGLIQNSDLNSGGASFRQNAVIKTGIGTLTLTGANTYSGGTTLSGGTLKLDYVTNASVLRAAGTPASGALTFAGGTLLMQGKSTGATVQPVAAVTLATGGGALVINPNGGTSTTLNMGAITATAPGSSLGISTGPGAGTAVVTTTTDKLVDGTYGGRITYGTDWATTASVATPFTLSAYSGYTAVATSGVDTVNSLATGTVALTGSLTTNSLKATTTGASQSLDVGVGNVLALTNGGLLFAGSNDYAITNGTLQSDTGDLVIHQLGSGALTIGSTVANGGLGATSLSKTGSGTVVLSGANTYTGINYVNAGTLSVGANNNLGDEATGATLNFNGGTLRATSTFGLFNVTAGINDRAVTLGGGGGTLEVTGSNDLTVSGTISNATAFRFGPLVKTGSGTLTLSNAGNTYGGATIIRAGTLSVSTLADGGVASNIGNSAAAAPALVLDGGTLRYTGGLVSSNRAFTLTPNGGTLDASGSDALTLSSTFAGIASGTGNRTLTLRGSNTNNNTLAAMMINPSSGTTGITKMDAGRWVLTNTANAHTGDTTVGGGTLALSAPNTNNIASSARILVASGATLDVTGLTGGGITLGSAQKIGGAGTISGGGGVTTVSGSGVAPGDNGVGTLSAAALTLSAGTINDFEFASTSSYDVFNITGGGSSLLLNGGGFNLYQTGTLNAWTTPSTYNLLTYAGSDPSVAALNAQANGGILNANLGLTYTWSAAAGLVTLNISGTPTLTGVWAGPSGSNWSAGASWTSNPLVPGNPGDTASFTTAGGGGTVNLDTNQSVGILSFNSTSAYTISGAGTLGLNNGPSTPSQVTVAAGNHTVSVPVTLNAAGATVAVAGSGDSLSISGAISGSGTISKSGAGTLALSGVNTYGPAAGTVGTTVSAGTLQVGNSAALSTGDVALTSSTTLRSGAAGVSLANNIITTGGFTTTVDTQANTMTLAGVLSQSGSSAALTKTGSGTLKLANNNTYTGDTTISAGTLQLGDAGTTGAVTGNIVNNGTLVLNRTDTYNVGNLISGGAGNVNHAGSGNATLTAANTFGGEASVSGGTLTLGNSLALQNAAVNYNNQGGVLSFGTLTAATFGGLQGAQNLVLENLTPAAVALTIGGDNATTNYSGALSGAGSIIKVGSGTSSLTGANTYTGTTTSSNGTIRIGGTSNLTGQLFGPTGSFIIADSAVVNTGALPVSIANASFAGFIGMTVRDSAQLTVPAFTVGVASSQQGLGQFITIQDSGIFTVTGTLNLNASNPGPTSQASDTVVSLNGGTLNVGNFTLTGGNIAHLSHFHFNGGLLGATASNPAFMPALTGLTALVDLGGARINDNGFAITVGANLLHGTGLPDGGLIKTGIGTVSLAGTNTYDGTTTISAGVLSVGSGGITGTLGVGPVVNNATLGLNRSDAASVVSNAISGPGAVVHSGTGRTTLSGTNTYTGTTTASIGTLQFGQRVALYNANTGNWTAANLVVNSGAIASFNVGGAGEFTSTDIDMLKALGTPTGGFTNGASIGLDATTPGTFTYSSNIGDTNGGANALGVAAWGGTLILDGANTYTGTTSVKAGTLSLGSAGAIGSTGNVTFGGGTLQHTAANTGDYGGRIKNSASAILVDTNSENVSYTGGIDASNTAGLTKLGTGVLTVGGVNAYTGTTTVNAGTLNVTGTHNANSPYAVTGSGLLTVASTGTVGASTLNSVSSITNNGSMSTSAGGTLTGITGTGTTSVTGGTLTAGSVAQGGLSVGVGAVMDTTTLAITGASTNNGTLSTTAGGTIGGLSGTGTTNVSGGSTLASSLGVRQGTLAVTGASTVSVAVNGMASGVNYFNALNIEAGSKLELHDNDLIVDYGANATPYATVLAQVKSGIPLLGFGGDGTGIASAEVQAQGAGGIGLSGTMLGVIDG
ncbi:MAG: autotransporter-associated beta strand repeat-containing protein, partial [Burkholderiales bacterium]|nr:autotransporter-associated beta strand repeat-containing protein [Phycisphaerae bacterium]